MSQTLCCSIPVRRATIAVSVLGVLAGGGLGVVFAIEIENGMMSTPHNLPAAAFVPYVSLGSWVALGLISFFGCVAAWVAKPRLASSYFWAYVAHYIIDLAFFIVTLFFCIKATQVPSVPCAPGTLPSSPGQATVRDSDGDGELLCKMPLKIVDTVVLVILVAYKLFSTLVIYVLFVFRAWARRHALEKEAQKIMQERPQQPFNYDEDTTKNWSKFDD